MLAIYENASNITVFTIHTSGEGSGDGLADGYNDIDKWEIIENRKKKKTHAHDITYLYTQISILFLATHNISTHAEINFDMFIYTTST